MSPDAQRIAIARRMKWDKCPFDDTSYYVPMMGKVAVACDPLNDLNAAHEMEKVLTPPQSERYAEFILDVLEIPGPFIGTARAAFLTGHASAAHRAEAFLRTLNLWTT